MSTAVRRIANDGSSTRLRRKDNVMTPEMKQTAEVGANKAIEVTKSVFDLDSKGDVLVKKVGDFTPVATMEEFVSRMGNNAAAILKIVNDGLEKYTEVQLEADDSIAWQLVEKDDETGLEKLTPFTGTLLSEEKSKSLDATVIQTAKLFFGYQKNMVAGDVDANRKAKAGAKEQALAFILSNPAAIENLKKS